MMIERIGGDSAPPQPVRFTIADLRCTVVSEGRIEAGSLGETLTHGSVRSLSPAERAG
jgi:hypothetical protein